MTIYISNTTTQTKPAQPFTGLASSAKLRLHQGNMKFNKQTEE